MLPVTKCEESTFASWTETVSLSPIYVQKIPFKFFTSIYILNKNLFLFIFLTMLVILTPHPIPPFKSIEFQKICENLKSICNFITSSYFQSFLCTPVHFR